MVKYETIEMTYQRCIETMASINRRLTILFELMEEPQLDRLKIARELSSLRSELKALAKLIETVQEFVKKTDQETNYPIMKELPLSLALLYAFASAWAKTSKTLKYDIESFASKTESLGKDMIKKYPSFSEYMYPEQQILERLYELISDIKTHMDSLDISIENELYQYGYGKVRHIPIALIFDLVTFKVRDWPGLNDKWACAACYLASLEVAVNKACKEWNIKVKDATRTDEFKKKLDAITQIMKQKGLEIIKIEKDIVSRLYDYRNRVLHGGYIPNDEEFAYIVKIIPKFIQNIQRCRT